MSVITGKEKIEWLRMRTLLSALKLETLGLKSRGRSAYAMVKRDYNLTGNRQKVYEQFQAMVESMSSH